MKEKDYNIPTDFPKGINPATEASGLHPDAEAVSVRTEMAGDPDFKEVPDYIVRMANEATDLCEKRFRLIRFIKGNPKFRDLPVEEQVRCRLQCEYMWLYEVQLRERYWNACEREKVDKDTANRVIEPYYRLFR